jgi:hypothetical protein
METAMMSARKDAGLKVLMQRAVGKASSLPLPFVAMSSFPAAMVACDVD